MASIPNDHIKEDEMGRTCTAHRTEYDFVHGFGRITRRNGHREEYVIDEKIILRYILVK
jgi:hypothetical protein